MVYRKRKYFHKRSDLRKVFFYFFFRYMEHLAQNLKERDRFLVDWHTKVRLCTLQRRSSRLKKFIYVYCGSNWWQQTKKHVVKRENDDGLCKVICTYTKCYKNSNESYNFCNKYHENSATFESVFFHVFRGKKIILKVFLYN